MKANLRKNALCLLFDVGLAVVGSLGLATAAIAHDYNGARDDNGPKVKTVEGSVSGFTNDGVKIFLGIPYAAPPVGKLRWMPPQPVEKWNGTLDATKYANTCPQVTGLGTFAGPTSITEDCLYLNVFTTGRSGHKKPVIVWIHGGGNFTGASNDYDGKKLATGGLLGTPTVVVSINYRLGLLGILSERHLNSEGHVWGNYTILDQQAALRWVRRNIEAFGGDPDNVTLGGQSAGAIDTQANLISPAAAGLFHRAILQSKPIHNTYFSSAATALSNGNAFAAAAGCSDSACLRKLSVARILQLQGTPSTSYVTDQSIIVDGTIIPVLPETAWTTGAYHHMPILAGTTKDELIFALAIGEYFSGPPQVALTPAQYLANNSAAVLAKYPLSNYNGNPAAAQNRVITDPFKCDGFRVLKQMAGTNRGYPIYGYDFTYQKAPLYFPQMPNPFDPAGHFQGLAYHTADIQFVFPRWHGGNLGVNLDPATGKPRELQGAEVTLSDQVVAAWTNFANTGNPNKSGNSPWPKFNANSPTLLRQDIPNALETGAEFTTNYKCDFWANQ